MNERHVVHARSEMRQQIANPLAAPAMLLPAPRARHHYTGVALEQLDLLARIPLLSGLLDQPRLVVERVALACRPRHEELHDTFRSRTRLCLPAEQTRERDAAKSPTVVPEKRPPVHR